VDLTNAQDYRLLPATPDGQWDPYSNRYVCAKLEDIKEDQTVGIEALERVEDSK
jgi:hypothetical protein